VSDTLCIQKVLKQGDASLPLHFTFALEYTHYNIPLGRSKEIRGVKLCGIDQLLVWTDILCNNFDTKEKCRSFVIMDIGLEVNTDNVYVPVSSTECQDKI
jgi:hypothetical protein